MAWYQPIPLLGAPQPTRMTSACPSLANMTGDPPYVLELMVFLLAMPVKAATVVRRDDDARRVENMMMALTVEMSVVVSLVVVLVLFVAVVVEIIAKDRRRKSLKTLCLSKKTRGRLTWKVGLENLRGRVDGVRTRVGIVI